MKSNPTEEAIRKAISEVIKIADRMPGVVILHDVRDWRIAWMSAWGLKQLNVSLEELTSLTAAEYYSTYFNAEDSADYVPKILKLLENDKDDDFCTVFQQVRVAAEADYVWHMSGSKVYLRDDYNKPLLVITLASPIDAMHHMTSKAARLLEENNFLRRNLHRYSTLSGREREILKFLALGKSSGDTAELMFISQNTVETHRKNIKQKLNTNSYYELCEYARAYDLI
ncbi:helix-turn-helix transcriptional regulator [Pedobacter psychroterrae]|nr:LuxR C-terminal-related transcriptional regulator [Pedobacter psychroterrae]